MPRSRCHFCGSRECGRLSPVKFERHFKPEESCPGATVSTVETGGVVKKAEAFQRVGAVIGLVIVVLATNDAYRRVRAVVDEVTSTRTEVRRLRSEVEALRAQIDAAPGQQSPALAASPVREASAFPMPVPMVPQSLPLPSESVKPAKAPDAKHVKKDDGPETEGIVLIGDAKAAATAPLMNVSLMTEKK